MDINTLKKIYGEIPLNHLSLAQQLVKKRNKNIWIMSGVITSAAIGVYIGYLLFGNSEKTKKMENKIKPLMKNSQNPIERFTQQLKVC